MKIKEIPLAAQITFVIVVWNWWAACSFHFWGDAWYGFPIFVTGTGMLFVGVFWPSFRKNDDQ